MKKLLFNAYAILAVCSFVQANEPVKPNEPANAAGNTSLTDQYQSAVKVSQTEWNNLLSSFQSANQNATLGGIINKTDLQNMLYLLNESNKLVYFRFMTDNTYRQTSVGFSGGIEEERARGIRNGGTDKAFCPTACNLKSGDCPKSVVLSFENYQTMSAAYAKNNTGKTLGGNIDKSALQAIINSLPEDNYTINFRFCTDPEFKQTSIIFMGGSIGQPDGQILYVRNGVSAESFCPTNCNND